MLCHIGSLTSLIVGIIAVVKMKDWQKNEYNSYDVMFTGHSWMGVTTVAVWALQFFFAVWLRLLTKWPPGTEYRKAVFAGVHQFMGYSVYAMGLATCATGFQDMQSYDAATMVAIAITAVGISSILLCAMTITAPANAPITAAVMPSTKALIDLFFAIFLK